MEALTRVVDGELRQRGLPFLVRSEQYGSAASPTLLLGLSLNYWTVIV